MGAIFTSFSAGQLTFAVLSGPVVDGGRGHIGLAASLALAAIGVAGMPLVQSFAALLLCTALQGAGVGFMDAGSTAMLMWLHPTNAGPWMQGAHAMFGVGAVISPVLVGLLSHDADGDGVFERETSRWPYIMYGTTAFLLGCVVCLLILPSPKPPSSSGSTGGRDSVYSSVGTEEETVSLVGPTAAEGDEQARVCPEPKRSRGRTGLMAHEKPDSLAVSWPVVVATAVVLAFYLGLEMGFAGFLSSYVSSALGAGAEAGASVSQVQLYTH